MFGQILEILLKNLKGFKKILKGFKKMLIQIWKINEKLKFFLLSILILSALTNLCSRGRYPGLVRSRYCICYSRNLGGGEDAL